MLCRASGALGGPPGRRKERRELDRMIGGRGGATICHDHGGGCGAEIDERCRGSAIWTLPWELGTVVVNE